MQEGCSSTYFLNVEDGEREWSAFGVQEGRGGTYPLNIEHGGIGQCLVCRRDVAALTH
jgi:hypothetical protein